MSNTPVEQVPVPEGYKLHKQKKPIFKRLWFWLLIAVVVIAIAATQSGGDSGSSSDSGSGDSSSGGGSSTDDSASAGVGDAVRDGKFEFKVSGIDCSRTRSVPLR